jgi:hypothetical protein
MVRGNSARDLTEILEPERTSANDFHLCRRMDPETEELSLEFKSANIDRRSIVVRIARQ